MTAPGALVFGTPNLRVSHSYEIGQLFDSASKLFKQPNWGNEKRRHGSTDIFVGQHPHCLMIGAKIYPYLCWLIGYTISILVGHIIFPRMGCDLWDGFDMICAKQWSDGSPIGLYVSRHKDRRQPRKFGIVLQPVSESKH